MVARGRQQFGPLPKEAADAFAELDPRTRELMDRVNDARDSIEDEAKAIRAEIAEVVATLDGTRNVARLLDHADTPRRRFGGQLSRSMLVVAAVVLMVPLVAAAGVVMLSTEDPYG